MLGYIAKMELNQWGEPSETIPLVSHMEPIPLLFSTRENKGFPPKQEQRRPGPLWEAATSNGPISRILQQEVPPYHSWHRQISCYFNRKCSRVTHGLKAGARRLPASFSMGLEPVRRDPFHVKYQKKADWK